MTFPQAVSVAARDGDVMHGAAAPLWQGKIGGGEASSGPCRAAFISATELVELCLLSKLNPVAWHFNCSTALGHISPITLLYITWHLQLSYCSLGTDFTLRHMDHSG